MQLAQLSDNPTARALADRLPLTLSFRDLDGVEKIAKLAEPLTTDGVPDGADPDIADIGYYAPPRTWCSTTATSTTGTASSASGATTTARCLTYATSPTASA